MIPRAGYLDHLTGIVSLCSAQDNKAQALQELTPVVSRVLSCCRADQNFAHLRMAVETRASADKSDPFLGYGSLIIALVLLHLGVFIFWLWQVTGATVRRPKATHQD